jgi:protease I
MRHARGPAELRKHEDAVAFTKGFAAIGRLIAAVCHGPQLLAAADLVAGRRMTSWREVADEVRASGCEYVDAPVVEVAQYITARKPGDMPLQMARVFERLNAQAS